jgi:tRNA threonylcarbamoyladenosine biosynthesis protein TsaB
MRILALETSTSWCSVAVGDGRDWHERAVDAGNAHSTLLLPMIRRALADAGWPLASLDAIAFGAGPGSFTGLRIGCGVTQGLALGADLPVVPVGTLAALALADGGAHVLACLDARMREGYVAAYAREGEAVREVTAPAVLGPDAVAPPVAPAAGGWRGAGNGFLAYPELAHRLRLDAVDDSARPTAGAVGRLAVARVAAGDTVRAAAALPFYVRHRVALTTAERTAGAVL